MKKRMVKMISMLLSVIIAVVLGAGSALAGGETGKTAVPQAGAGKKVYFAGPLFSEAEREDKLKVVSILEKYG